MTIAVEVHADSATESAAQLAQRIAKLQDERDSLEEQASVARGVLADLRVRLITGDEALGDVAVAQAKVSALDGAIEDADRELTRLRLAHAESLQREREQQEDERVRALHDERAELQEQINAIAHELDEACEQGAAKLLSILHNYAATSAELRDIHERRGNPRLADIFVRNKGWRWPELRFGEQISGVLTAYGNEEARRERREQAEARFKRRSG